MVEEDGAAVEVTVCVVPPLTVTVVSTVETSTEALAETSAEAETSPETSAVMVVVETEWVGEEVEVGTLVRIDSGRFLHSILTERPATLAVP